jgi:hypothetical protein
MQLTPNLKLKKPEASDAVNIEDLNGNTDVLDAEVTKLASTTDAGRMSAADKVKLNGIAAGAQVNPGAATTSAAGLMSAADKSKLDGVAMGANNYTHPSSHPPSIIIQDSSNRFVTDAEKAAWNAKAGTAIATGSANGLMPAADKAALNAATNAATASTLVKRDSAGRMKATAPAASDDVARKAETDAAVIQANTISVVNPVAGREAYLLTAQNWNAVTSGGFYRGETMINNPPFTMFSVPWVYGTVIKHDNDWIFQTVTNFENTETYQRIKASGIWSPWKLVRSDTDPVTRVNAGKLEFYDGGEWKSVGENQIAVPSDTVQYQELTTRQISGDNTNYAQILVGKFIAKRHGIMRIKCEINSLSGAYGGNAILQGLFFQGGETFTSTFGLSNLGYSYDQSYGWDLPIGSVLPNGISRPWSGRTLTEYQGQGWRSTVREVAVSAATPFQVLFLGYGGNQFRNLQICYDIIDI